MMTLMDIRSETTPAYKILAPKVWESAVVFASPHSGADYSDSFLAQSILGRKEIRSSEDAFVDQLFAEVPKFGAPLLTATKPRAYLDLNRAVEELDPALIEGVARRGQNPRVASGLGVADAVLANPTEITTPRADALSSLFIIRVSPCVRARAGEDHLLTQLHPLSEHVRSHF